MYAGSSNLKCMEEEFRCMMMLMLLIIAVLLDITGDYYLYTVWITGFHIKIRFILFSVTQTGLIIQN